MPNIEKIIRMPGGDQVQIPGNLIPEVEPFVSNVFTKATDEFATSEFGHAAMALASAALDNARIGATEDEQRASLRLSALKVIKTHGKKIIPLLRNELRLSLTDEDLKSIEI